MSGIAYEQSRLGIEFSELLPALLISELVFFISYFAGHWLLSKLNPDLYGSTGKLLVLVGGSQLIRGLALEASLVELAEVTTAIDTRRLPGDFTVGVLVAMVVAYVMTARTLFVQSASEIERVRAELLQRRELAAQTAQQAEQLLRNRAQEALLAKLDEIQKLLAKTDVAKSAEKLRRLIKLEVRPLSKEIWNRFELLAREEAATPKFSALPRWPRTLPLKRGFRPSLVFLFANLNLITTANALGGAEFALTLLLFSFSMLPLGGLLRSAIPDRFEPRFAVGMVITLLLTGLMLLPTWVYLFSVADLFPGAVGLRQTGAGLVILVSFGIAIRASYVTSQERALQKLQDLNDELAREIALVEQSVWIAKRNWSFVIHGTVQGALTVAHSRLKLKDQNQEAVLQLVAADIEKAKSALEIGLVQRQSLDQEFQDLITTWDGVCSVKIQFDAEKLEAVDETAKICTVEIMKEIVGNAFRHGKASEIDFAIEFENGNVEISAKNNGVKVTKATEGLGSDLLNELSSSWSITNVAGGVMVRATVPYRTSGSSPTSS
jgi:signal transduction histidine kinase